MGRLQDQRTATLEFYENDCNVGFSIVSFFVKI